MKMDQCCAQEVDRSPYTQSHLRFSVAFADSFNLNDFLITNGPGDKVCCTGKYSQCGHVTVNEGIKFQSTCQ